MKYNIVLYSRTPDRMTHVLSTVLSLLYIRNIIRLHETPVPPVRKQALHIYIHIVDAGVDPYIRLFTTARIIPRTILTKPVARSLRTHARNSRCFFFYPLFLLLFFLFCFFFLLLFSVHFMRRWPSITVEPETPVRSNNDFRTAPPARGCTSDVCLGFEGCRGPSGARTPPNVTESARDEKNSKT